MGIDLRREISTYAARLGRFDVVTVPPMQFLMVDGHGDPNVSSSYADALATLYRVAYALKFRSKREFGRDYRVMPLEALWWAEDIAAFTTERDKSQWSWTVMTMIPDWIAGADVDAARTQAARRDPPLLQALRCETLDEGLAIQTLHIGPYDDEGPVLATMHDEIIPAHGLRMTGHHHEIYLNDARRTAPQRLRTILRQPVTRA